MNKGPQTIGGPPAAPHPPPSGISQTAYPSGQTTATVVFAPQQSPQMNTQPQPRQFAAGPRALHQQYYPNRAQQQNSASRVQSSATTRPVASATHVYPPGSQTIMMMTTQQIPTYPSSGPYYVPGQFRSSFVQPTQQYPVPPGTGFYSNPNPGEYPFGTYYPTTQGVQPYSAPVAPATVMINPTQPQMPPKRERKQIRIRDPNQGGKDITEEIMSGGRSGSTPTPPQSAGSLEGGGAVQANGENPHPVPVVIRPDKPKSPAVVTKPVEELNKPEKCITPEIVESKSEINTKLTDSEEVLETPVTEPDDITTTVVSCDVTVTDSEPPDHNNEMNPLAEPISLPPAAKEMQKIETEKVEELQKEEEVIADEPSSKDLTVESNGVMVGQVDETGQEFEHPLEHPLESPLEIVMDSPIAQPEELKLTNGLELSTEQVSEVQPESDISPISEPETTKVEESAVVLASEEKEEKEKEEKEEEDIVEIQSQDASPTAATVSQTNDNPVQAAAVSVPKKKRKMKDLNKKEAVGDLLDAFKESQVKEPAAETDAQPVGVSVEVNETIAPTRDEPEETWEEKEDKQDVENIKPDGIKLLDQKYQYKEENWKPLNPEDKKKYDREFLLGFQFIFASMQKPEGLPAISDVVLDKANKTPLRPVDPSRLTGINCGPDFIPPFANVGRQPIGRGPPSGVGTRRSQQGQRKEPRKIIATVSLNDDIQLKKAEHAWKPSVKKPTEEDDPDMITQELFRKVRSILNKLTPQMFQQLMKQVAELTIDNEERLKGVIDLVFEKAISEPNFSVAYANMCRCLTTLKVPIPDKPGATVNFRKLLLNRCQKEFEKDKDDDAVIDKKQKEIDAAVMSEEKTRLQEELKDARDKARRRSLGNIKFIGELFKLKMLTEPIMHDCIVKLLKNHDEESLECLCRLLTTIGKDLDFEKAKPRMDQYFNQMEKIIKERKTSSRIRFMVQDVIDLRQNNWVPRRGDQGPKTLEQIHREAQIEEHQQQLRVQQQLLSKQDKRRGAAGSSGTGGRGSQGTDEAGWNTVPIAKSSRPIDTSRLSKITKAGAMDYNNQVLAPAGRLGGWVKGSSGGSGSKPSDTGVDSGRPTTATLNRFSALQQSSSTDNLDARRVVPRSSSSRDRSEKGERERGDRFERNERYDRTERSDRFERSDRSEKSDKSDRVEKPERSDRNRPPLTKRSYSKEVDDRSRERERRSSQEPVRRVASMTEERDRGRARDRSKESVKLEPVSASVTCDKPALSEEEFEKKSKAIIEEYLHINDMKEALQCVQELESPKTLHIFVRSGIESTLERSAIAREHMGMLLYQLVKAGTLSKEQYCKGLHEILEIAEDMEIDIPHIWQYLAELIVHMLHDGGIPMGELFREVAKPLITIEKAGLLLADLLCLLCKGMSRKKAGSLWREGGLSWKEFLPEEEDINKFVTEKKVEFTLGNESSHEETPSKTEISFADLCEQFDKLIKEKADNQRIFDWIEANLDEKQMVSPLFIRALMKSVCHSAVVFENPVRVDVEVIQNRVKVLTKYLNSDPQRELQALYALQALMAKLEQPPNLLRTFFDVLYDEDVISEEAFYKWESSKDPAEQQGKGVALKSVTAFFTWLREAEEESEGN
ncbi:eukaryotic translation initiation factor 4 gamma 1a isoform X2 [Heterodontus francisci]|uniref:eukaryotic translation initiation factor 4 gamma 1a isoform X2 n=1 Tax=Heterodontus francisci TaxID=7792 RepID=UPI00355C14BC